MGSYVDEVAFHLAWASLLWFVFYQPHCSWLELWITPEPPISLTYIELELHQSTVIFLKQKSNLSITLRIKPKLLTYFYCFTSSSFILHLLGRLTKYLSGHASPSTASQPASTPFSGSFLCLICPPSTLCLASCFF